MKNNILKIGFVLLGLFVIMIIYLSYLQVVSGPALADNPYNQRFQEMEAQVRRGTIYDAGGAVLAKTEFSGNRGKRVYPAGAGTAHLVGFVSQRYGRTGIESVYDRYLLGMDGPDRVRNFTNRTLNQEQSGGDVFLTVDSALQRQAMDLLGGRRGAVILLDVRTGAIRLMASSPTYDPNQLDKIWAQLLDNKDSPLINRTVQGAYPPGSTFKVVTAAGALTANPGLAGDIYDCPGYLMVNGYRLTDLAAHGEVDTRKALALSCNTTFARMGLKLGADGFNRTFRAFGLEQDPLVEIPVRAGTMAGKMSQEELASSSIGQGELMISPLHMALVAAGIAKNGVIMRPYLVETVKDSRGEIVRRTVPEPWLNPVPPNIAGLIKEGMVDAVQYGTARGAAVAGMKVAGKTGSAQNPKGQTHAWFIGFAPADQPRMAIAVILENAGSGGAVAAPIAGRLLSSAAAKGY